MRLILGFLVLLLVMPPAARAIQLSQNGSAATLSGLIESGDDHQFRLFLARPGASQIRTLYLDSRGGMLFEAYKISEMVRAAGISTVVDARRNFCASACTVVFVGGMRRYYLNAQGILDGDQFVRGGLGFHQGSDWASRTGERQYSFRGSYLMVTAFREMGVPGAADLINRARFTNVYRVSAATALSLGIATSLKLP